MKKNIITWNLIKIFQGSLKTYTWYHCDVEEINTSRINIQCLQPFRYSHWQPMMAEGSANSADELNMFFLGKLISKDIPSNFDRNSFN